MGFREAVKTCLSKYSDFEGRAPRSEYWYWGLFISLAVGAGFLAMAIADVVLGGNTAAVIFAIIAVVAGLGLFLPSLAVTVRRLHDTNSSGWWYLLTAIPYVGGLIMFVWFCIKGTTGSNRFGPDPLEGDTADAFS